MSAAIATIITTVICLALSSGTLFVLHRRFRGQLLHTSGPSREQNLSQLQAFDHALETATQRLETMLPLEQIRTLEAQLLERQEALKAEQALLREAEAALERATSAVTESEEKQNALRQGREQAERLSDDLYAKNEEMSAESRRLESQLKESMQQLEAFLTEQDLSIEQKKAVEDISKSATSIANQLAGLEEVHKQTSERCTNLQKQYDELEAEYKRLMEAELAASQ